MRRRDLIKGIAGSAAAWPLAAYAQQQSAMPVVAIVNLGTAEANARFVNAFSKGLEGGGWVEGQNVTVEYHWLEGQFDRLSSLMADLVHRRVAVIATPAGNYTSQAAKAATTTIPIVFGVGEDPVRLGLVSSLARPGGNATGYNFLSTHALVPKAVRVALLVNPANVPVAGSTSREAQEAARAIGLQLHILNASTDDEIEAAFDILARDRPDALLIAADAFLVSRRVQLATLTARYSIPAAYLWLVAAETLCRIKRQTANPTALLS
jgi:putative tryptophan/tyrosine transport system substrate-binding protein